ncbi:EAL domain-containing protein [Massilia sp. TS11]|uniref:EAL domain-containing protein n=1 Tax=Massilia sp. TS11 TaxID=2908003 RepID=UPI001EDAE29E|nr:EAL domain-containing protein [Massilia sp. TS11]MCG2584354.1 EAL domain-containing protein [Massilia sp. TS11]
MKHPILQAYLERLANAAGTNSSLWRAPDGVTQGRFFKATLTSAFQPIRSFDGGKLLGFDALVRSGPDGAAGLSPFKLLDGAASEEESIHLDRLCRTLHAINFFRQADEQSGELYLRVHDRLLAAVDSNHGYAFLRILQALELPIHRIVLALPATSPTQAWLLNYVADNYRRNGFRLAVQAASIAGAADAVERIRPAAIKLDASIVSDPLALRDLILACRSNAARLIVKRVESLATLDQLALAAEGAETSVAVQGFAIGAANAELLGAAPLPAAA